MSQGTKIEFEHGQLKVPNFPIIPFIEGDGIGPEIWQATKAVFEAAVSKAYGNERKVIWQEVLVVVRRLLIQLGIGCLTRHWKL